MKVTRSLNGKNVLINLTNEEADEIMINIIDTAEGESSLNTKALCLVNDVKHVLEI